MTNETRPDPRDPFTGMKRAHRLYGRVISDVDRLMSGSPLTLTERRIVLELVRHPGALDAEVAIELGLDRSHLSRTMTKLIAQGLVGQERCPRHRSQRMLTLTERGTEIARRLDAELGDALSRQLETMSETDQAILVHASSAGSSESIENAPVHLRRPKLSDFGWLLGRTAGLDSGEHRSGEGFAAHMAGEIQAFLTQAVGEPRSGWIACRSSRPVGGCLMIIGEDQLHARIGLVYVEPIAWGLGIGRKLIEACVSDAERLTLLTVTAEAADRQKPLTGFLRATGFHRSRATSVDYRYGPADVWRTYARSLSLHRPTPEEAEGEAI